LIAILKDLGLLVTIAVLLCPCEATGRTDHSPRGGTEPFDAELVLARTNALTQRIKGWMLALFVQGGTTPAQVHLILGQPDCGIGGGGRDLDEVFVEIGIIASFKPEQNAAGDFILSLRKVTTFALREVR
jgi:hypothetical protein